MLGSTWLHVGIVVFWMLCFQKWCVPHRAGRKCCFGVLALFDPPSVLMVAPVVLVFQQHKPKGVCLFILETNERLVQHAAHHHYTTKALDRPWSNAGVCDVLV